MAVRRGFRHHLARNGSFGAGSVIHHHRLAESLGERLRDDAGPGVRGPSGGKRHDDADGSRGILRSRWNRNEAQSCYGGEDAHQLLHGLLYVHALVLPLRFIASSGLLRLESSRASRVTPIDELLLKESAQLAGRRAARIDSLLFKLFAHVRLLQDDVHLAGELVDDVHWCLCRREQTGPDNHGNAWYSRFGNGGHARKQRTPRWEQRREGAKPAFLYQRNDRRTCAYDQLNACAQ